MTHINLDRAKGEKRVYPSRGRCIYCFRSDVPLEDEHIIPFGISGDGLVFENASCRSCASIINKEFETHVIGSMFLPIRIRAGAPTRNKAKRPKSLELNLVACDSVGKPFGPKATMMVSAKAFPLALLGWTFPRVGIIAGREPSDEILGSAWVNMWEHEYAPYVEEYRRRSGHRGIVAVSVGRMEQEKFFRFLAKTAYASAIAEEGFDAFEPLVLDLIFGRSKHFCHYIGAGDGHDDQPVALGEAFRIRLGSVSARGVEFAAALLQPFALLESPKYIVIVGKRERAKDETAFIKKATDTTQV